MQFLHSLNMRRHSIITVLSVGLLAASLSACGGSGSNDQSGAPASGAAEGSGSSTAPAAAAESSQSVEEGCTALETEFQDLAKKYEDTDTSDQAATLEAFGKMMEDMKTVGNSVTNPEVGAAWGGYVDALEMMGGSPASAGTSQSAAEESLARLEEASQKMQQSMSDLSALCPKFQEAADMLDTTTP